MKNNSLFNNCCLFYPYLANIFMANTFYLYRADAIEKHFQNECLLPLNGNAIFA